MIRISALLMAPVLLLVGCGQTSQTPTSTWQVESSVGTYAWSADGVDQVGTALLFKLRLKGAKPDRDLTVSVRGPAGWNADRPSNVVYPAGADWVLLPEPQLPPLAGKYEVQASAADGTGAQASVSLADLTLLPRATDITVTTQDAGIAADWGDVAGAAGYYARLFNATEGVAASDIAYTRTSAVSLTTLGGKPLDLSAQKVYFAEVYAANFDTVGDSPALPAPLRLSRELGSLTLTTSALQTRSSGALRVPVVKYSR